MIQRNKWSKKNIYDYYFIVSNSYSLFSIDGLLVSMYSRNWQQTIIFWLYQIIGRGSLFGECCSGQVWFVNRYKELVYRLPENNLLHYICRECGIFRSHGWVIYAQCDAPWEKEGQVTSFLVITQFQNVMLDCYSPEFLVIHLCGFPCLLSVCSLVISGQTHFPILPLSLPNVIQPIVWSLYVAYHVI